MYDASLDERNETKPAHSSGVPNLEVRIHVCNKCNNINCKLL